jgi:hypothetical protein
MVLAVSLFLVVLELDVEVFGEKHLNERLDARCIVVPPASVHVRREGERDRWGALGSAVAKDVAGIEVVGAGHLL